VKLTVPDGGASSPAEGELFARLDVGAEIGTRGFFHVAGLRAGTYILELTSPDHAPLRVESVGVQADAETFLPRAELHPYGAAEFVLLPPFDPDGEPWQVTIQPTSPAGDVTRRAAAEEGMARFERVVPGTYRVTVATTSGARLLFVEQTVEGSDPIQLSVPFVAVEGEVRVNDEPLPARVTLRTGAGDSSDLAAGEDGKFRGWIRRPDRKWVKVEVSSEERGIERTVDVAALDLRRDRLRLELFLEDRRLAGSVVDEQGTPVDGVRVWATLHDDTPTAFTDRAGRFQMRGLSSATYLVHAENDEGLSEPLAVDISAAAGSADVQLVLRRRRLLEGTVYAADGQPVPGALVRMTVPGRPVVALETQSDVRGRFSLRPPPAADRAVVKILAPSQLLWSGCLELPADGEMPIRLPSAPGGEVRIRVQGDDGLPPARGGQFLLVTAEAGILNLMEQSQWQQWTGAFRLAKPSPESLERLPRMAPGAYAVMWSPVPESDLAASLCSGALTEALDWQHLEQGGAVTLVFDALPHQKATLEALRKSEPPSE
jgi:hypothetical protein